MKQIEELVLPSGESPYGDWIERLDSRARARIEVYVDRVASGGAKRNIRLLGDGVFEIKIDAGPGYRVYFGELGGVLILLLLGGDKGSQDRDIAQAKMYWRTYVSRR